MTWNEVIALAALVLSVGTNVALYVHLSGVVHQRFDAVHRDVADGFASVERRLELMQGSMHELDIRLTKLEK